MTDFNSRRAGAVWGSLTADALSLGVHWIYDPVKLAEKHGRIMDFYAPGNDSYHPGKQAGEQSHVGDQALRLMDFLTDRAAWNAADFLADWRAMWLSYEDYFDHATKETLSNLEAGKGGASSNELAGPARIAPLAALFAPDDEERAVSAAQEQTALTHDSVESDQATVFLARATIQLINGAELQPTIEELAPAWALEAATNVLKDDAVTAIGKLGQSCPIPAALPGVIYLALKHGDDLEVSFIENAMAGGDNCARALALGMLLGAAHGVDAIPIRWRENLVAAPRVTAFLERVTAQEIPA